VDKNFDVVFFDGDCNLCNKSVSLLVRLDKKRQFRYASLESDTAKSHLSHQLRKTADSVVFLSQNKTHTHSTAAIEILLKLDGCYKWVGRFLNLFPRQFLNIFYKLIAKNRYRLFGKANTCRVPTKEEEPLFLD